VSAEIQELAAAIRDALAVPIVDTKQGRLFDELMLRTTRMAYVRDVMDNVIDGQVGLPAAIRAIRSGIEQAPVTYVPFVGEQPGSGS
jgi:hypothetical protein